MLVGDRHQPGQPLQVFGTGEWVVYPGVAGVLVQIGHGGGDRALVGGLYRFVGDVVGQCPQQRLAFGCCEGQIEPVHAAPGEAAPGGTVGCDPVIKPARRYGRIGRSPVRGAPIQADQLDSTGGVAGDQPGRLPGVALGVVLPQSPVGAVAIPAGLCSLVGGVVVIVDAPPR